MRIEYKKKIVKYINTCDRQTKQQSAKFIPEVKPEPDEIEEITAAKADTGPTIRHEAINWD